MTCFFHGQCTTGKSIKNYADHERTKRAAIVKANLAKIAAHNAANGRWQMVGAQNISLAACEAQYSAALRDKAARNAGSHNVHR